MCKALRIRVLMLALIVVGRNPGSWLQILSLVQLRCESSRPAYRLDFPDLEQQCYSFRTRGLAPLIWHSYASAQAKFISFCWQLGNLHPSRSPCLMDEWTLCLIVMFLARTLQHLLIKVNLSGFRALHMDQGCSHLLADCLRLQRDIHGIKRCQVLLRPCGCL